LDGQLSEQFVEAKKFIGDDTVVSVESRADLRKKLQNRKSGGVFLTTIQKFTEDIELLTDRTNVICISDEAHRSQTNLDQKIIMTETGVRKTYGFAKYLHDSLPNATYVGFTGTPIDSTIDVFGEVADAYTMTQSVLDEITVRIVYEGRAAKVNLENSELEKIEQYYQEAAEAGANEYQIDKSKEQSSTVYAVLGNPERLDVLANDFIQHYEQRVNEGSSVMGKAMFVSSSREIGYEFYKRIIALRPEWNEIKELEGVSADKKKVKPIERVKLVMTRSQDDPKELYELLGTKEEKSELARQFKEADSNFKIAIVVDMWLTGFDVPFLDSIYIDKPIQQHNLIQTISRVNRKYKEKEKGLVVDYIGIKNQMDFALQKYSKGQEQKFEEIEQSVQVVKNQLDLLDNIFVKKCDYSLYFTGAPSEQLSTLNTASDFVLQSEERKSNFMGYVKRLKAAYDICSGSELLTQHERDLSHFFFAVRTIIYKITKGNAPDVAQMNARVREMVNNALNSSGVEEILKIGEEKQKEQDLFDEEYLELLNKLKLPNTKIQILQKLLQQAIVQIKKVNKIQGVNFSEKMQKIVEKYNTRDKNDIFRSEVYDEIAESLTDLILQVQNEFTAGLSLGIDLEEKAFYDILFALCVKYNFTYPDDKMIELAKEIKKIVDSQANYPDWNKRDDIKARLKVDIIIILDTFGYPPVTRDEVYMEIFEQAENFKKYRI
jgi:type I restriction enzyme R subunit